jgi:hypothetical protein
MPNQAITFTDGACLRTVNLMLLLALADGLTGARYCFFNRLGRQLAAQNGCYFVQLTMPFEQHRGILFYQPTCSLSSLLPNQTSGGIFKVSLSLEDAQSAPSQATEMVVPPRQCSCRSCS